MAERGWDRRFEQYAADLIGRSGIPGAAVALAHKGKVVYERGFGHRDAARKLPVTPDTRFGLGSVTKSFPALAIMQLEEAGVLSVDDPVTRWLPEFRLPHPDDAQYVPAITIHHFLTHSSGLPPEPALLHARAGSIAADPDLDRMSPRPMGVPADIRTWERVQTYEELMALMGRQRFRLLGPPGQVINYSNEGYVLLAAIVERASGRPFAEYLQECVLDPLAMPRTGLYTRETPPQEPEVIPFAVGVKDGKREVFGSPAWWDQGQMFGNGGLKSTVQDLLRYLEVYRTGGEGHGKRVLSQAGVKKMTTPHMPIPLGGAYGYGLRVADVPGLGRTVGHSGGNKGVATQVVALPEQGVTAVALTNLANAPAALLVSGVVNAYLGQPPEAAWATYPEHEVSRKQLSRFVGVYQGQPGTIARVAVRDGVLYVALADELQSTRPYSDTGFVIEATGEPLCFLERPSSGAPDDARAQVWALFSGLRTMPLAGIS
ncbi:MAG: serine hydrolase domain-containing protein [Chloroflexota bacterium]